MATLWADGRQVRACSYPERKRVQRHGVRVTAYGWLLVPLRDAAAASLHEATGRPVAVAFDAGNLAHVAKALRTLSLAALLVLCGDDDVQTHERSGTNLGRTKATPAASGRARAGRVSRGVALGRQRLQ